MLESLSKLQGLIQTLEDVIEKLQAEKVELEDREKEQKRKLDIAYAYTKQREEHFEEQLKSQANEVKLGHYLAGPETEPYVCAAVSARARRPTRLLKPIGSTGQLEPYPSAQFDQHVPPIDSHLNDFWFSVCPPSPFHEALRDLIARYVDVAYPPLRTILPLLEIWLGCRDIPADELGPTCLALMVLGFLKAEYGLPHLEREGQTMGGNGVPWPVRINVVEDKTPGGNIIRESCSWFQLDVVQHHGDGLQVEALRNASHGAVLFDLFEFFANFDPSQDILASRGPPIVPRKLNATAHPKFWKDSTLVVSDPFLTTHNHAHRMTEETCSAFSQACKKSATQLQSTAPLHTIFGPGGMTAFRKGGEKAVPRLHPAIGPSLERLKMSQTPAKYVLNARAATLHRVQAAIKAGFHNKYHVECFESSQYGVDSSTSDLDMVIFDPDRPNGLEPSMSKESLPKIYNMRKVRLVLQNAGFTRVIPIPNATVPIVKFFDPSTRINIDLNCNNRLGAINTALLRAYCDAWPPLRTMIVFVKRWAKSISMNDPSGSEGPSTLSSYCLTLMVVGFLQYRGILPNLQDVGEAQRNQRGFWCTLKKDTRLWCDTAFLPTAPRNHTAPRVSLGEVVYEWFKFFAYKFPYTTHVLDITSGGIKPRHTVFTPPPPLPPKPKKGKKKAGPATEADVVDALAAEVEAIDLEPEEELTEIDVDAGEEPLDINLQAVEPSEWKNSMLVVVDPFIRVKNCCSGCRQDVLERFQQECERAVSLLERGEPIDKVFGVGSPLFYGTSGKPRRNRGTVGAGRGGGGGGKRRNQQQAPTPNPGQPAPPGR